MKIHTTTPLEDNSTAGVWRLVAVAALVVTSALVPIASAIAVPDDTPIVIE